jgi:hypothetical protein
VSVPSLSWQKDPTAVAYLKENSVIKRKKGVLFPRTATSDLNAAASAMAFAPCCVADASGAAQSVPEGVPSASTMGVVGWPLARKYLTSGTAAETASFEFPYEKNQDRFTKTGSGLINIRSTQTNVLFVSLFAHRSL